MITQENKLSIVKLYNEGSSLSELSRLFAIDTTVIKSILCEYNIHIRTRGEQTRLTNMKRSKSVDNFYFSNIDTVNKAWVLGFLAADGSIAKERNTISISLSRVDREILEKIKKEIKIERTIHDSETNNGFLMSRLEWSSLQQKIDLSKYDIVNKKTYLPIHLPQFNNDNLTLAYILGYFDGDGSITINNNKYLRFRICSHRNEILQDIADFIEKKYKATYSLNQDKRKLYELSISTTYAIPLLNDCYNLNSIHLDRKYQKYLEYKRNQETTTSM